MTVAIVNAIKSVTKTAKEMKKKNSDKTEKSTKCRQESLFKQAAKMY